MRACDLEYHRPAALAEAVEAFCSLAARGREPVYYGGGTEILARARAEASWPGAIIDLKAIPELRVMDSDGDDLVLGAALSLDEICEHVPWPLLAATAARVADHTTRCRITLGGNLAGRIPYREVALALLLGDVRVRIMGPAGTRSAAFTALFRGTLQLAPGEFLVGVRVGASARLAPHAVTKRTRLDWVDYPIATVAAVRGPEGVRAAASGLLATGPVLLEMAEDALAHRRRSAAERADRVAATLPADLLDDLHASREYRRFVFQRALTDVVERLEGA